MVELKAEDAEKLLSAVHPDKKFWCNDGQVFGSLIELESGLKNIKQESFLHHVNSDKNDFCNWLEDVIGDRKLSLEIRKIKNKNIISKKVKKHVNQLKMLSKKEAK